MFSAPAKLVESDGAAGGAADTNPKYIVNVRMGTYAIERSHHATKRMASVAVV